MLMRPDLTVEQVGDFRIFFADTAKGREWLQDRFTSADWRLRGRSLTLEDERQARDLADLAMADGLSVAA